MLSGRPPFESQTPEGYLGMHLHQAPPALDTTRVPLKVAPAIAAVVSKALEKQREKRFHDAREFSDALARLGPALTESVDQIESTPTVVVRTGARSARTAWAVAVITLVAAGAAIWAISRRDQPSLPPVAAALTPSPGPPTPRPTEIIDEIVAPPPAPRVIEGSSTTQIGIPRPQTTKPVTRPTVPPPPTAVPTPVPTLVPTAAPAALPEPPAADWNNPERARQRLSHWMSRPVEERARRSPEISRWANKIAAEHPDHAGVKQLKHDLPLLFKGEALAALDRGQRFIALQFYRAYTTLDFAPADPELAQRMNDAPPRRRK
jgi:hypothetical protein